jgi:lipoate-protein ligase A
VKAMTTLYVVQLYQTPILEQLQLEEALLRADQRNWCLINEGSPPAIVMGISGKPHELIQEAKWSQSPVPIIRRFSGGGTVFIDENTYFATFICQTSFVSISPFPEPIMRWTEELYKPLFAPHPFSLQENDYTLGHYKFGGNAQSICKNRWLHHSSFLWDYSSSNMEYLLYPKKTPHYRQQRVHTEFLCRLRDYWSHQKSFREKLTEQLQEKFEVEEVKKEELQAILHLPHRKATMVIK